MVSLNVSQDDMIDILISQANVDMSMNADENHSPSLPPIPSAIHQPVQPVIQQPIQPVIRQPIQPAIQPVSTQNSPIYPEAYAPFNPPILNPPRLPAHNEYVCRGCQQSILYTNRSSLVQLLSLHQQKCPGSRQYRYMCLECHSAFKSVAQLQAHESNCRGHPGPIARAGMLNDKQQTDNCTGTGVIQSLAHEGVSQSSNHYNSRSPCQQSYTQDDFSSDGKFPSQMFNTDGNHTNNQTQRIPDNPQNSLQDGQMSAENYFDTARNAPPKVDQLAASTNEIIGRVTEPSTSVKANNVEQNNKEGDFMHSMSDSFYEQQQQGNKEEKQLVQGTESPNSDVKEQNVFVRDSWSQTFEQPPEEEVVEDILLDEISPAGRKRRTCARKLKVYREKELRKQREHAEIESLKRLSYGRRRAKIFKQQLKIVKSDEKVLKNVEKAAKLIKKEENVNELLKKVTTAKRYKKGKKEKEPDLEVPMQCQQCPKTFTKYSMYTRHYQYYHERAMCQYCGTQCIRRKLKSHEATHLKAYKCTYPGCTKVVNSKHRLTRHSRIHTGEKPFKCEVCDKAFAGKENMVKHRKRVHEGEKPYQCRYCGRKFADTGRLKYHEGTHTKPRPTDYRCKFCGRGYKSHVGCYLHERTHTGNTVKCQYCGKAFMAKEHLKRHEYIHTGNYPFRCPNCQKGFKDAASMRKHKCLAVL